MIRVLLATFLMAVMSVPAVASSVLSADELKKEIIGKRLGYSGAFSGDIRYLQNGKISYTAKGKRFGGTWRMTSNKICTRLETDLRGGRDTCFTFSRAPGGTYRTSLGYKVWRK